MADKTPQPIRESVDRAYDRLACQRAGFRSRPQQREMIDVVADTLSRTEGQTRIAAIEGQTGTGKTIAYLLPAIICASAQEKTLIISTATTALQTQLIEHELPNLASDTGLSFTYRLAVGRGRYACPNRLALALSAAQGGHALFDDPETSGLTSDERESLVALQQKLDDGSWLGCRDDLADAIPDTLWSRVASNSHSCPSADRCKGSCPFHRARASLREVDVIVANHDLVLSDLALGGGKILTPPDDTFYVFDEAHSLPDKAVDHAATQLALSRLSADIGRLPSVLSLSKNADASLTDITVARQAVAEFRRALADLSYREEPRQRPMFRAPFGVLPEAVVAAARRLQEPLGALYAAVLDIREAIKKRSESHNEPSESMGVGLIADRLDGYLQLLGSFATHDGENGPPRARWIIDQPNGHWCYASPITAAPTLQRQLWSTAAGVILTSATLTSLNSWARFRAKTGLAQVPDVTYRRVASPFDYASVAELDIPEMLSCASKADEHNRELIARLPALLQESPNGTLVLFTSWHQLKTVYYALPRDLRPRIRTQGQMGHDRLIASHREAVDAGQPSVLFGLASMAEGLDLPGNHCCHVIIAKLPFSPPTSPVDATRAEWLARHGKDPFRVMAMPEASLKLIQACGRLIRTESDRGRITILDRRLVTKRYGAGLLNALPKFKRTTQSVIDEPARARA